MTHGVYAERLAGDVGLDDLIVDLNRRIVRLGEYLEKTQRKRGVDAWYRGLDLYSKLAGRSARLMRTLRWLSGDGEDRLYDALEEALDEIAGERGIDV